MSAEERMAASEKGYENGLGAMSAEERKAAGEKGYENGIGMMSAEERIAASEKGYENELGAMSAEERKAVQSGKVSAVRAQSDFDKWIVNLSKVKTFIADKGRTPRRKSSDAGERILANWISNSKINKEREQLMRRDIPSIFDFEDDGWHDILERVKTYIADEGRKPTVRSSDADEKKLAGWIHTNKKRNEEPTANVSS